MKNEDVQREEDAIFATLDNCWFALCERMRENPTEETRRVMNMLARIIATAKSETSKRRSAAEKAEKEMSVQEWIAWFEEA